MEDGAWVRRVPEVMDTRMLPWIVVDGAGAHNAAATEVRQVTR